MELKFFTIDEANMLIPRLRVLLGELSAIRQRWNAIITGETVENILEGKKSDNTGNWLESALEHQDELEQLKEEFNERYQEIQNLGCQLKDVSGGLIDFPALKEDKIILLCWKLGESTVKYWHDLESGFSGRQPL